MSRHSGSSRHRSHHSKNTEENTEDLVEQVKSIVTLLYEVVSTRPHEWETYLPSARSAITALDHLRFFRDHERFAEQVWILHGLQDFAFHDADSGSIQDIAEWCQTAVSTLVLPTLLFSLIAYSFYIRLNIPEPSLFHIRSFGREAVYNGKC
jgi:hypothetical protein